MTIPSLASAWTTIDTIQVTTAIATTLGMGGGAFWWFYRHSIAPPIIEMRAEIAKIIPEIARLEARVQSLEARPDLAPETARIDQRTRGLDGRVERQETQLVALTESLAQLRVQVAGLSAAADAMTRRMRDAMDQLGRQLEAHRRELQTAIAAGDDLAQLKAAQATVQALQVRLTLSRVPTGAADPQIERDLRHAEQDVQRLQGQPVG